MKSKRKRIRRPKYLSLRHQLAPAAEMPSADDHNKQPMTLFPLQPAADQESNVARLFTAADGGGATLAGLLPAAGEGSEEAAASPSSASAYSCERGSSMVVRAALRRSREREDEEEEEEIRWVRMSEVVGGGGRTAEEEVSSRAAAEGEEAWWSAPPGGLSLKLDYKEVLEAWCDKERPFLGETNEGEAPQTVPDLHSQHDFSFDQLNGGVSEQLWRVPSQNGEIGQREASVLRYREKRMNRLFSKRIRYQVRKLNAEKRPRVKGRFVKRS